jgi:hypothetical protein
MLMLSQLIVVVVSACWLSVSLAADYYVAVKGSDRTPTCSTNSESNPFFSLNEAMKCVGSSSTVNVGSRTEMDTIFMSGGDYEYDKVVSVANSVRITNNPSADTLPRIRIFDCRAPFFAIMGNIDFIFENIAVSGFNVINQNIPSSGFIYSAPGFALANSVTIQNVNFQNWDAYDNYQTYSTHVIAGLYETLTVSNCSFTTQYSYYVPNSHINAAAVKALNIIGNTFDQLVILRRRRQWAAW